MATKLVKEYMIECPTLNIPASAPEWVQQMYPVLMTSIYEGFSGILKKVISDFNDSFVSMQKEIDELAKLTKAATEAMESLKQQLRDRDHFIDDQQQKLTQLSHTINKNETYSRRDNLVFGCISAGTEGSCTEIVHHIMCTHLGITDPSQIKFVRCHYLSKPSQERKGTIIARFESFGYRMQVWSKRRSLYATPFFLSEDFPADVSKKRNKLRPILKEASKHQQYQKCITLKHDQLHFDGTLYSTDNLHGLPKCIHPRTLSERRSKGMLCFGGILSEYHELCNFFKCDIEYKGVVYHSVEQAYQHNKAVFFGDHRSCSLILRSKCPTEIKAIGRTVVGFEAARWNGTREKLMREIIHQKFAQNPNLKQQLCDTGTIHLAEATRSDDFFGTGMSITHPSCLQRGNWTGKNMLGEILMDTRRDLRRTL